MPGLDRTILDAVDQENLLNRIRIDVRTDFILAPHLNSIFVNSPDEIWSRVDEQLRSGTYQPGLPLTTSVPKERGFARPGSILQPFDRVVYQLLIDIASSTLDAQLDRNRTFSHLLSDDNELMFEPAHESWERFQNRLVELCQSSMFIVKADVANYFERIPQHHLINLMNSSGCLGSVVNLMEEILLAFQERDSFGIIQGVFASDMLGNFFLSDLDAYCDLHGIESARYVDDIYMAFDSEYDAQKGLINLIDHLRKEGLHLNEQKSGIHPAEEVIRQETEVDDLFSEARTEAKEQLTEHLATGYGFTAEWDVIEELDEENVELAATKILYDAKDQFPNQVDKIERFCLPLMRATGSDYAVDSVMRNIMVKPYLTRLYHSYLSRFTSENVDIVSQLSSIVIDDTFVTDYQRMYVLGSLLNSTTISRDVCNRVLQWLQPHDIAKETRALAAIFVAKHGSPNQKRAVRLVYESEPSEYVKSAILYGSRYFVTAEKRTCCRAWGGHTPVNALIAQSL